MCLLCRSVLSKKTSLGGIVLIHHHLGRIWRMVLSNYKLICLCRLSLATLPKTPCGFHKKSDRSGLFCVWASCRLLKRGTGKRSALTSRNHFSVTAQDAEQLFRKICPFLESIVGISDATCRTKFANLSQE